MPLYNRAESYFIIAMMILIFIICTVAVVAFFKTYKKEMKGRAERQSAKEAKRSLEDDK
jgi:flagellar basal body-associated protein FliL